MLFQDRTAAGQSLARRLTEYANRQDVLVLALPRGGVPVAFEVAQALHVPLDIFVVRKLGVPKQPELAMGAIASGGICVLNRGIIRTNRLFAAAIHQVTVREQRELARREQLYRGDRPVPVIKGRTIILVDDGIATGATMRAAIRAIRQLQPTNLIVAVPVASPETCRELAAEVEKIICVEMPEPFSSVGYWYGDFSQTTDAEVHHLLEQAVEPDSALDRGQAMPI